MKYLRQGTWLVVIALMASGCATTSPDRSEDDRDADEEILRDIMDDLRRASIETRDEMRLLSKTQQSLSDEELSQEQHEQRMFESTYVPDGFEQIVDSFNYQGHAHKAAEAIASMAGYEFQTPKGRSLADPPMVNIRLDDDPLIEGLRDLGMQVGDAARIELEEPERVIRYIHLREE